MAAVAGALLGALVFRLGLGTLRGLGLGVFLCAGAAFAVGACLFQRGLRRRARMAAIADLLPRYLDHHRDDEFLFDEPDLDAALADRRLPAVRAEIRAATRALLVSLEEEMRRQTGHARRSGRPGCRRARLRAAGRSEPRRRRIAVRLAIAPS